MERFPHGSAVTAELGSKAMGARRNDPLRDVVLKLEVRRLHPQVYTGYTAPALISSRSCVSTRECTCPAPTPAALQIAKTQVPIELRTRQLRDKNAVTLRWFVPARSA